MLSILPLPGKLSPPPCIIFPCLIVVFLYGLHVRLVYACVFLFPFLGCRSGQPTTFDLRGPSARGLRALARPATRDLVVGSVMIHGDSATLAPHPGAICVLPLGVHTRDLAA